MTTYGEIFEKASTSNVAFAIGREIDCAGETFVNFANSLPDEIVTPEVENAVNHIAAHLKTINALCSAVFSANEEKIKEFAESDPGKLDAIREELQSSPVMVEVQRILDMTPEQVEAHIDAKNAEILDKARKIAEAN